MNMFNIRIVFNLILILYSIKTIVIIEDKNFNISLKHKFNTLMIKKTH